MENQFQYIVKLADDYKHCAENSGYLFQKINELPEASIREIYDEYAAAPNGFQPVNLLRAEVARQMLSGSEISAEMVEEVKDRIRQKETNYFAHLSTEFLQELEDYRVGKRDMFANWQKQWNVFHVFLYRGKIRETVQLYLEQLCKQLIVDLQLADYAWHWVDFYGASNFGSEFSWLSLFPRERTSHKEAYQFHLQSRHAARSGQTRGLEYQDSLPNSMTPISDYESAVRIFQELKPEIIQLNKSARNFYKFAPGEQASKWEEFRSENVIAVNYDNFKIGRVSEIPSREDLNISVGLPADSLSNETWNLWLFKTANPGDIVFANRGKNICPGVGVIIGDYHYEENAEYPHRRQVEWITDKVYQHQFDKTQGFKNLFRPDTFAPTLRSDYILSEYVRLYPELTEDFDRYDLKYDAPISQPKTGVESVNNPDKIEDDSESVEQRALNFWWLNANPSIWSISDFKEGERQTYTSFNEKGNKRRIYKYFEAVEPGDLIIGYESSPVKQIKGILEVTKPLHISESEGEIFEFELIEKLEVPVHWHELQNNPALQNCEPFINNQGSLFELTEDEFDLLREIIDEKNIVQEKRLENRQIKPYVFAEDTDKPFIPKKDFQKAVELLRRKQNIILQGPPGVGKTFVTRKIAYELMGEENDAQIEMVQFRQSYSYEDFIQGLRPSKIGFELKNGTFYNFCQQAHAHPDRKFFFIIDEINRGNLSKIFGELMMLIEADKRSSRYALKLTYAEDEEDRFFVPANLYIIGTMNTADRSLAIVDYALRRRFAFINLQPEFGEPLRAFLREKAASDALVEHLFDAVSKVNAKITADVNLGSGFKIGHSYFCDKRNDSEENEWFNEILTFEIRPLLEEIWFDDLAKVEEMMAHLIR